jgi:hypothetical protein
MGFSPPYARGAARPGAGRPALALEELMEDLQNVTEEALPRTFRLLDGAASRAQAAYWRLVRINIVFGLVLASGAQLLYSLCDSLARPPLNWPLPVKFWLVPLSIGTLITLITRTLLRSRQREKTWYQCRAGAEEIRSRAWRYMMAADSPDGAAARQALAVRIDVIRAESNSCTARPTQADTQVPDITSAMDVVRAMTAREQAAIYLASRVADQESWYDRRARLCARQHRLFTVLTAMFEAGGVLFAALLILSAFDLLLPRIPIAWTTFLWPCLTGAGATLAWMGYKRFGELSASYGVQARELASLRRHLERIASGEPGGEPLPELVRDVEGLLSREIHTWFMRRGA